MMERFATFSRKVSDLAGRPVTFLAALALVVGWALTGPFFGWSDSHSLFINTVTTCLTFLMVFLIQSAQNRDTKALHAKLNELICASEKASNTLIDLENDTEAHLVEVQEAARANKI